MVQVVEALVVVQKVVVVVDLEVVQAMNPVAVEQVVDPVVVVQETAVMEVVLVEVREVADPVVGQGMVAMEAEVAVVVEAVVAMAVALAGALETVAMEAERVVELEEEAVAVEMMVVEEMEEGEEHPEVILMIHSPLLGESNRNTQSPKKLVAYMLFTDLITDHLDHLAHTHQVLAMKPLARSLQSILVQECTWRH